MALQVDHAATAALHIERVAAGAVRSAVRAALADACFVEDTVEQIVRVSLTQVDVANRRALHSRRAAAKAAAAARQERAWQAAEAAEAAHAKQRAVDKAERAVRTWHAHMLLEPWSSERWLQFGSYVALTALAGAALSSSAFTRSQAGWDA